MFCLHLSQNEGSGGEARSDANPTYLRNRKEARFEQRKSKNNPTTTST